MGAGEFLPMLGMVIVQIGYAGMNITSKLAMDSGMNPFVLVAYRQIFAAIAIIPFALFLERKTRPKITRPVLLQILLCSVFGATGNQIFYFIGLKHSTPTIACALGNVLPAITFILAIPFRLETVGMKSKSGQAKVLGTVVCVGGAMLLSFYHGAPINIGESHIHWKLSDEMRKSDPTSTGGSSILGPFLIIVSCIVWAAWFIIQARLSEKFAAPYTSTALMCFMASIQCVIVGAFAERSVSGWSLSSGIRLIASLYAGIVGSALAFFIMTWCIQRKGPLYVSVFSPLLLVIVAALSWAFLQEKLYVGTVIGSLLIVAGLYTVLWGKDREMISKLNEDMKGDDLEMQFAVDANGKPHPTT